MIFDSLIVNFLSLKTGNSPYKLIIGTQKKKSTAQDGIF